MLPLLGAYPVFVMKVMCYALFACAFNLLIGFTGLLSFGHAAFLGGAAYAAGHALKVWGVPMEIGLLIGIVAGAVLGLVMGMLAIRRSGIYFSMITLALAQMLLFRLPAGRLHRRRRRPAVGAARQAARYRRSVRAT